MKEHIIIAPATAPGIAGVSMIRVSGSHSIELVDQIFRGSYSLKQKKANEIAFGKIISPKDSKLIDEVLIGIFHAPYSFTGEESLEIWTHGSPYIVKEVIKLLESLGAIMAEPGEFSMRAFLNGKIDLTQAEAIRDLTQAQTKFAHIQAISRLEGGLSKKINDIHTNILDLLAILETAIDHAEEEYDLEIDNSYISIIDNIVNSIKLLLSTSKIGKMSIDGIKIALIGRPNVGKSSLLNTLVDEDRVIVSPIAGTTRDIIEHRISCNGLTMCFFDTAGLRDTKDSIELQGTERTIKTINEVDIILHIFDSSMELQKEDQKIITLLENTDKYIISILNKIDLPEILQLNSRYDRLMVSTINNEGINQIFEKICSYYHSGNIDPENEVLIANIRQESLLTQVLEYLNKAKQSTLNKESEEFITAHIRNARISLEEIVGKTTDDTILDRIFSQFCIGK